MVGGAELRPVVVGAAGDAVEHEPVVGIRLQIAVGGRLPLVVRIVVQLTSRERGDLVAHRGVAIHLGADRHVAALVGVSHVQPDTLQFVAASIGTRFEALHQSVLVLGQDGADVGARRLVQVLDQRCQRWMVVLRSRGGGARERRQNREQHQRGARCAARRPRQRVHLTHECDYGRHRYHDLPLVGADAGRREGEVVSCRQKQRRPRSIPLALLDGGGRSYERLRGRTVNSLGSSTNA